MDDADQMILDSISQRDVAQLAFEMVQIESPTRKEGKVGKFYAEQLEKIGLEVEMDEIEENRHNVIGKLPGAGDGPSLMFNGHLDTIPIGNCVRPKLEGGVLWGRGSEDMKGGLAAATCAVKDISDSKIRLKGDLWITGTVGHESPAGHHEGAIDLAQRVRKGQINADAIVVVEGPPSIWISSLGMGIFTIALESPDATKHTLTVPLSKNPIFWMSKLIQELHDLQEQFESEPGHPLCGKEHINLGIVEAGDYFNRVPALCKLVGTRRWVPAKSEEDVTSELRDMLDRLSEESGIAFRLELSKVADPYETSPDETIVQKLKSAAEKIRGSCDIIGMKLVADGHIFRNDARVPTAYYGPTYITAHSDNEHIAVDQLFLNAQIYALTALDFCEGVN